MVCEKVKNLVKFHDSAKKNLMITITMDECLDYASDDDKENNEN